MILHSHPSQYLFLSLTRAACTRSFSSAKLPKPPTFSNHPGSAEEVTLAREWLKDFSQCSISRDEVEMTFARSSGPGGQNVNKVNTKATIRCSLDKTWIPPWARIQLRNNPAYVASSNSLLVSSTQTRSQAQNIDDCFKKLHAIIYDVCSSIIPTPPDSERMARKRDHERAMKARNRASKMYRSAVKSNRRGDWRCILRSLLALRTWGASQSIMTHHRSIIPYGNRPADDLVSKKNGSYL